MVDQARHRRDSADSASPLDWELSAEARRALDVALSMARDEQPPAALAERVVRRIESLGRVSQELRPAWRGLLWSRVLPIAAALAAAVVVLKPRPAPPIAAEISPGSAPVSASLTAATPPSDPAESPDPCRSRAAAVGESPLIDDFEDGDDSVLPLEQRAGLWRWARETDALGSAPALLPIPRPGATPKNQLALHVKGSKLVDWGATVEFAFEPACYDASTYPGIAFEARGPGRIYVAPRETSVIPVDKGGTCQRDCYNPHTTKVDLDGKFRTYVVRWADVHQRGFDKPPLDSQRLHSVAFLIRPEDTPYDVWIDSVRFAR
jgi:hypothetical protein